VRYYRAYIIHMARCSKLRHTISCMILHWRRQRRPFSPANAIPTALGSAEDVAVALLTTGRHARRLNPSFMALLLLLAAPQLYRSCNLNQYRILYEEQQAIPASMRQVERLRGMNATTCSLISSPCILQRRYLPPIQTVSCACAQPTDCCNTS
jgi:hypothetical protein